MAKVDAEVLLDKLKTFIKENIGTIISDINSEKNDSIVMSAPHANAYVELSMDNAILNYDPFIFIYVEPLPSIINGPRVQKDIKFEVVLFKAKESGITSDSIMGLRYMRAMEELGIAAWDKVFKGFHYNIETMTPIDVQLVNSTKWHSVYGISLTVSLS